MTTDPGPDPDIDSDSITSGDWHRSAARAYRRDLDHLETAYSHVTITPALHQLFTAAVWHLNRDHVLTLSQLPAMLHAAHPQPQPKPKPHGGSAMFDHGPNRDPDLIEQARAALTVHRRGLYRCAPVAARGRQLARCDDVSDTGRTILDLASNLYAAPVGVAAPTNHPASMSAQPPTGWSPCRSTFAILLRRRDLLLGYHDRGVVYAFPQPEAVHLLTGGRVVTVRTETGRLLILDGYVDVYRRSRRDEPTHRHTPASTPTTATPDGE
jgi:hypothetical protein